MVAPAIWRRAVALTRKRIEASVPLTLTEIQADKDRMRAEFAMSTRRLEMSIKAFRDKAAAQIIEINRNREELKRLADEPRRQEPVAVGAGSQGGRIARRTAPARGPAAAADRQARRGREGDREQRALELEKMGQLYDEASLVASNRQIELVVRETEVEKLAGDMQLLRGQRKEAERRMQEIAAESKAARDALKGERKKVSRPRKEARAHARHADRPRGEARPARARAGAAARAAEGRFGQPRTSSTQKLIEAQADKVKLEAELADMTLQMSTLLSGAKGGDIEKAMAKLAEDRERLESRLTALTRENKKLRTDLPPTSGRRPRTGATSGAAMRCCASRSTISRPKSCR